MSEVRVLVGELESIRFAEALEVARSLAPFDLVRIETALHQEGEVAERIANEIRSRLAAAKPVRPCA